MTPHLWMPLAPSFVGAFTTPLLLVRPLLLPPMLHLLLPQTALALQRSPQRPLTLGASSSASETQSIALPPTARRQTPRQSHSPVYSGISHRACPRTFPYGPQLSISLQPHKTTWGNDCVALRGSFFFEKNVSIDPNGPMPIRVSILV